MSNKEYNLKQIIEDNGLDILEIRALAHFANIELPESELVSEPIAVCITIYAILKACKFKDTQLHAIIREAYKPIVAYLGSATSIGSGDHALMVIDNRYLTMPTWDHVFDIFELKSRLLNIYRETPAFTYTISLKGVVLRYLNK